MQGRTLVVCFIINKNIYLHIWVVSTHIHVISLGDISFKKKKKKKWMNYKSPGVIHTGKKIKEIVGNRKVSMKKATHKNVWSNFLVCIRYPKIYISFIYSQSHSHLQTTRNLNECARETFHAFGLSALVREKNRIDSFHLDYIFFLITLNVKPNHFTIKILEKILFSSICTFQVTKVFLCYIFKIVRVSTVVQIIYFSIL